MLTRRLRSTIVTKHRIILLAVAVVFTAGLVGGVWSASDLRQEQVTELDDYIEKLFVYPATQDTDSASILRASAYNNTILFMAIYIAGLSVIGIPVMLVLLLLRGFALGFALCLLVADNGWQGLMLATAALMPQNLILVPAVIIAGAASLSFSLLLIHRGFNPQVRVGVSFGYYTLVIIAALAMGSGAALVEAYISPYLIEAASTLYGA